MVNTNEIKKMFMNEYIFSLFSKCIMVIIGLVESALLARYLGAELRGNLSYIHSIASTAYLIITFGIYTIYPFKRKELKTDIQKLINEFMTVVCVIFLFYFIVLIGVGTITYPLNSDIGLILFMLPLMGYAKVVSFVFMIEHPNQMNLVTVGINVIQCAYLCILMFGIPKNIIAGVSYYLLGEVLKGVCFSCKLNFKVDFRLFKIQTVIGYAKYGFFPMVALWLTTLNYRLDIIMLKQYSTISLAQVGIYSIGVSLGEKALLIPDAIKEVLLSKLVKGKGEQEVARVMRICFFVSIMTAAAINLLSGLIINVLYGAEYAGAERVTYICVWGTTVMVFFKMVSQYNVVQHKQHLNVIFLIASIIVNFVFNLYLIPKFGINGAAIATIIGHLITSTLFLFYFKFVSKIELKKMILIQKDDLLILRSIIFKKK